MVTMKDIADKLGISRPAVSYVLNGRAESARIPDKTKKKILEAAKKMGYCRDEIARSVKTGKTKIIAFITTTFSSEHRTRVLDGVMRSAFESGYFVKMLQFGFDADPEKIADICQGQRLAGALSYEFTDQDFMGRLRSSLHARNIPFGILAGECCVDDCIHVGPNNLMGARLACEHLYSLGHRSLMCLDYFRELQSFFIPCVKTAKPWAKVRLEGFYSGVVSSEVNYPKSNHSDHLFFKDDDIFSILKGDSAVTGFYCLSDHAALRLIMTLIKGGVRVPEDVSVVGQGDFNFSEYSQPAITTINEHLFEVGNRGFELLLERINSKDRNPITGTYREKIDLELIVRESSGKNERI